VVPQLPPALQIPPLQKPALETTKPGTPKRRDALVMGMAKLANPKHAVEKEHSSA